ncbi:MAG: hypothetical protein MHPSP_001280, partial [Paramarteilia canceri]
KNAKEENNPESIDYKSLDVDSKDYKTLDVDWKNHENNQYKPLMTNKAHQNDEYTALNSFATHPQSRVKRVDKNIRKVHSSFIPTKPPTDNSDYLAFQYTPNSAETKNQNNDLYTPFKGGEGDYLKLNDIDSSQKTKLKEKSDTNKG